MPHSSTLDKCLNLKRKRKQTLHKYTTPTTTLLSAYAVNTFKKQCLFLMSLVLENEPNTYSTCEYYITTPKKNCIENCSGDIPIFYVCKEHHALAHCKNTSFQNQHDVISQQGFKSLLTITQLHFHSIFFM